MSRDQVAELRMLMSDPKTFITLHTNKTEDGRYILNGSASVRHDSRFRDSFLNPSRSYHNLPHYIVTGLEWTVWTVKGKPLGTHYKAHDTTALIYACGYTIRELVHKNQTPTRGNVDILSGAGDTVPREINSYESLLTTLGIEDDEMLTGDDEMLTGDDEMLTGDE